MITIKDFMEVVNYRITEGSEFGWQCFGPNAYRLDSWNNDQDGYTISILFDTRTQEVYQAEAYDYHNNRVYRLQNPAFIEVHVQEAKERNIDPNEAMEDDEGNPVRYIDLEVDADFLNKARAIVNREEYDTRVQVELDLEDEILYNLMKLAHEQDITLNKLFENILIEEIDRIKSNEDWVGQELQPAMKKKGKKK